MWKRSGQPREPGPYTLLSSSVPRESRSAFIFILFSTFRRSPIFVVIFLGPLNHQPTRGCARSWDTPTAPKRQIFIRAHPPPSRCGYSFLLFLCNAAANCRTRMGSLNISVRATSYSEFQLLIRTNSRHQQRLFDRSGWIFSSIVQVICKWFCYDPTAIGIWHNSTLRY